MGVVEVLDPVAPARAGGWKVDVSRGERNGRVSSEWFNRPDDERYLSLDDLWASVKGRSERSRSRVVQTADIRVEAARDNPERLHLVLPKAHEPVASMQAHAVEQLRLVGRHPLRQARRVRGIRVTVLGRIRHRLHYRHALQHRAHLVERGGGTQSIEPQRLGGLHHGLGGRSSTRE